MARRTRYRCRYCGAVLPGWLAWANAPDGALLLGHLGQSHRDQVGVYLDRLAAGEDIGQTAAEAYELIEVDESEEAQKQESVWGNDSMPILTVWLAPW